MNCYKLGRWLQGGALALLGLFIAFWSFMGIGEMAGGDLSGLSHLVPALLVLPLIFLAWKRLLLGGIILVVLGLAAAAYFYNDLIRLENKLGGATITGGPFLLAGLLLLVATALARPKFRTEKDVKDIQELLQVKKRPRPQR